MAEEENEIVSLQEDELNEELDAARTAQSENVRVNRSAKESGRGCKMRKLDVVEKRMLEVLEQEKKPNRHLSFFEGITPSLNDFTENEILQFQTGVLKLIMDLKRKRTCPEIANAAPFARNKFNTPILHYGNAASPSMYPYSTQHIHPASSYYPTTNLGSPHATTFSGSSASLPNPSTPLANYNDDSSDVNSSLGNY